MGVAQARGQRRNLVIVRAGAASLHPYWLRGARQRSWDMIVSYYDDADHEHPPDVRVVRQPGGKWDGLYRTLKAADVFERYDYIWLPDDDLMVSAGEIERLFGLMRQHDLAVGQPALTPDSYFTHFLMLRCPGFVIRFTNFVEIMAPCLRADILEAVHRDFADSMSGFGLDGIWCRLDSAGRRGAVLDSVTMKHTRPLGHGLRATMTTLGISAEDEESDLRARYGLQKRIRPIAYLGVRDNNSVITGKRSLGLRMMWAYLSALSQYRDGWQAISKIIQMLRRQLTRPVDLSPLCRAVTPPSPLSDVSSSAR